MKHALMGGQRDGELVEVLYPVNELVFPPEPDVAAVDLRANPNPSETFDFLRYTRREFWKGQSNAVVYAVSSMADEEVRKEIGW